MAADFPDSCAFYGLGAMGFPIAGRLSQVYSNLIVSDIVSETVDRLCSATAAVPAINGSAAEATTVFLCLPTQDAVQSVLEDKRRCSMCWHLLV